MYLGKQKKENTKKVNELYCALSSTSQSSAQGGKLVSYFKLENCYWCLNFEVLEKVAG